MVDFSKAQIYTNGSYRPLVKEERILVEPGIQKVEEDFPLSPTLCFLLLAAIAVAIAIVEYKRHRCLVWFDALLMLLTGIAGCLLFVMLFSEHPTTSTNLQILLLNPISLAFIPSVLLHKRTIYWKILLTCLILFFAGWFIQDYAEGMEIMACCLLTRFLSHKRNDE
jgi:membrane-associated HD superfamily phosphohydrolase